jgi:hypothetical protein
MLNSIQYLRVAVPSDRYHARSVQAGFINLRRFLRNADGFLSFRNVVRNLFTELIKDTMPVQAGFINLRRLLRNDESGKCSMLTVE